VKLVNGACAGIPLAAEAVATIEAEIAATSTHHIIRH